MPHHKSCKKRLKQSQSRRLDNRQNKASMRSSFKVFRALCASEETPSAEQLQGMYSILDIQARKGIMPRKRAARLKSRIAALVAK